jgi:hypothetical protein
MPADFGLPRTPLGTNDASPQWDVGSLYYHNGAFFRYVKFLDAVTYAVGDVCEWGTGWNTVSNDRSGGTSIGRCPAGICLADMTQNYYGFIQVAGTNISRIFCDDAAAAAGSWLVSHTVDKECDIMAAGEEQQVFGFAIIVGAANYLATGSVVIKGLI